MQPQDYVDFDLLSFWYFVFVSRCTSFGLPGPNAAMLYLGRDDRCIHV